MPRWDDLQVFAALHRTGRVALAARRLGVSVSTVARRLQALEHDLEVRLFDRAGGTLALTPAGQRLLARVDRVEEEVSLATAEVATAESARTLRLTAPEALGGELLVPILSRFRKERPEVAVELTAANRVFSLVRREADIAVRLQMPEEQTLIGRRLSDVASGLYAADAYLLRHGRPPLGSLRGHRLVGDGEETAGSREERWLLAAAHGAHFAFRSDSTYARRAAIVAGLGVGVLAGYLARRSRGLQRVWPDEPAPLRELWIVIRPELRRDRAVRALFDSLTAGLERLRPELARS